MAQGEWKTTKRLIGQAAGILAAESPMTIRQLFYRLVSVAAVANTRKDYQRVSTIMTKARNDGRVGFDSIVDRSRPEYMPSVFDDAVEYADVVKNGYRKDYWRLQPERVELWCEKDSVIGSIERLTSELGIMVRVTRGYLSTTKAHDLAAVIKSSEKPMTIFFLGDHDPSGRGIETDLAERIRGYGVKESDSRAVRFLRRYGNKCVELDALPPTELRRRIEQAVTSMQDRKLWDRAVMVEKAELRSIR